jgi:3'(2'), 5'-bisphosphate nucleotidase
MPDYDCDGTIVRGDDLVKISQGAGKRIMEVYEMPTEDWAISAKGDESPLTRADLAANALICEELGKLYPDIPIVSEENKMKPWEERKGYKYFFCVDPLVSSGFYCAYPA